MYERVTAFYEYERDRREVDRHLIAWQTAHLLNVAGKHMKKNVTVDDLLGKTNKKQPQRLSAAEQKKELEDLKSKFTK